MARRAGQVTLVARRRRRASGAWLAAIAAAVVLAAAAVVVPSWTPTSEQVSGQPAETGPASSTRAAGDEGTVVRAASDVPRVVARAGALELVSPVARPFLLGFHEAGEPEAVELAVVIPLAADLTGREVRGEVVGPDGRDPAEPTAIVLPSRGRAAPAASALDVVARDDDPVVAPVDGRVVVVEPYRLYGRHDDVKVVIRPEADDTLEVVLLHLVDVAVRPGDDLVAGSTVVARAARPLPVASQVDRFTRRSTAERARPHVHLEVRRASTLAATAP